MLKFPSLSMLHSILRLSMVINGCTSEIQGGEDLQWGDNQPIHGFKSAMVIQNEAMNGSHFEVATINGCAKELWPMMETCTKLCTAIQEAKSENGPNGKGLKLPYRTEKTLLEGVK